MKRVRGKTDPAFVPDYMATSVTDIDFDVLLQNGVKYIAFDADNTLVPYFGTVIDKASLKYLSQELKKFKGACIASNRITDNLSPLAVSLNIDIVKAGVFIRKPRRRYYRRVLKHFHAKEYEVAMIGDKLRTDIWGANRMNIVTVWVEKIGRDILWDRVLRVRSIERWLLKNYIKKNS